MLRFAAEKFYKLSDDLGHTSSERKSLLSTDSTTLGEMDELAKQLGLDSTRSQLSRIAEIIRKAQEKDAAFRVTGDQINGLFEELQRRVYDDLQHKLIYCVESERTEYCNPQWMVDSVIANNFPSAIKEVQAAGRCYAFGEAQSSAFHSMRALEVGLGVLAKNFGVDFQNTNWHNVIEGIESKIRAIGNLPKSPHRLEDEKFFGGLALHFMFLKNAWRNHVMHVHESYNDKEARQMLEHVVDLLTEMSPCLSEL